MSIQYYITSPYIFPYNSNGRVVYSLFHDQEFSISSSQKQLLLHCRKKQPIDIVMLNHACHDIEYLKKNHLIFVTDSLWEQYNIKYAEIEINSNCNYRCEYCPNYQYKKPVNVMSLDIFTYILRELKNLGTINYLTLHAFNEPTIAPHFQEYLRIIKEMDYKLELFTNASNLNQTFIKYMKGSHILRKLKINLPSIDKGNYIRMTGYHNFAQAIKNIHAAIDMDLPIEIICNGTSQDFHKNYIPLVHYFEPYHIHVKQNSTNDRAGILENKYAMNYYNSQMLTGCNQALTWLHFNYQGDLYLCFMDYFQKYIYANIHDGNLTELLKSPSFQSMRKQIFGMEETGPDFLCRKCWNNILSRQIYTKRDMFCPDLTTL